MDNVSYKPKDMKESLAPATTIERPGDVMFRAPDPEVLDVKPRRNFTAKYELRILDEAD